MDNQLPLVLSRHLTGKGHEAIHVLDLGLDDGSDTVIWNYAAKHGYTLITKDEDFFYRAVQLSATVPVLWIRLGNCRNSALLAAVDQSLIQIETALQNGQMVIEIR